MTSVTAQPATRRTRTFIIQRRKLAVGFNKKIDSFLKYYKRFYMKQTFLALDFVTNTSRISNIFR